MLGPVEVLADGERVALGPRQQRLILAVLALEPGRVVSIDRLVDLLWPENPPPSAREAIPVRIRGLRKALGDVATIETRESGYVLEVVPEVVDAHRFRSLVERAEATDDSEAVALLTEALSLWQGPALSGVADEMVRGRFCEGLEEARLVAMEDKFDALLRHGEDARLLDELTSLCETHRFRERFVRQRMLALHRAGQTRRALEVEREYRKRLEQELGVGPSVELGELQTAILRNDPNLHTAAWPRRQGARPSDLDDWPCPKQLPLVAAAFTGRDSELREMDDPLDALSDDQAGSPVVAITGPAGVGKTALAIRWARRAEGSFPDGQLYLDLRGHATKPALTSLQALIFLLSSVGVEQRRIPSDPEQAATLYRSVLAGRKVLVVLDNAASAAQVRPLLPSGSGCAAVVTSRDLLSGLIAVDGVRRIGLDMLPLDDAEALLTRLIDADRLTAESQRLRELAEACGRLPLALRIAAARVVDTTYDGIDGYLAGLRSYPLDELRITGDDHAAVATVLDHSYQRLEAADRRLFRLLGLVPGPTFTVQAAVALAGGRAGEVSTWLDRLVSVHLVEPVAADRFRFHDLVGHHARLRAGQEETADACQEAMERLLTWYYLGSEAAGQQLFPASALLSPRTERSDRPEVVAPTVDETNAVAWFEAERDNIEAAVNHTAEHGPYPWAWELVGLLGSYFQNRALFADEMRVCQSGDDAAQRAGQPAARSRMLMGLAYAIRRTDADQALILLQRALDCAQGEDALLLRGACLNALGLAYLQRGELDQAEQYLDQALEIRRHVSDLELAHTMVNLAQLAGVRGRFEQAAELLEQAADVYAEHDTQDRQALVNTNLGWVLRVVGRPTEALTRLNEAADLADRSGRRSTAVIADIQRALLYADLGLPADALEHAQAAAEASQSWNLTRHRAMALGAMAAARITQGDTDQAVAHGREAVSIACTVGQSDCEAEALLDLAAAELAAADATSARTHAGQALEIATADSYRPIEAQANTALAEASLTIGTPQEAADHARRALELHTGTGHHLGLARAHRVLGRALWSSGQPAAAAQHAAEAIRLFDAYGSPEADQIRGETGLQPPK